MKRKTEYIFDRATLKMIPAPPKWYEKPFKRRVKDNPFDIRPREFKRIRRKDITRPARIRETWSRRLLNNLRRAVFGMVAMQRHVN